MTHHFHYRRKKEFLKVIAGLELIRRSYQAQMMESERPVVEAAVCNQLWVLIMRVKELMRQAEPKEEK